jgi:hypothetical protein
MEAAGLIPSDSGEPGGKKISERVSHYIAPDGRFDLACRALLDEGFTVPWLARTDTGEDAQRKQKRRASKTKYACPSCDLTVWGKLDLKVICGVCEKKLEPEYVPDDQ